MEIDVGPELAPSAAGHAPKQAAPGAPESDPASGTAHHQSEPARVLTQMVPWAAVERRGRRVVVTGAAGFIGSHLAETLLRRGEQVTALDRAVGHPDVLSDLQQPAGNPRWRAQRTELALDDLDDLLVDVDTVFHLAAVPGVRDSWDARFADYAASNVVGTHRLLGACERAGVRRLVLASSSRVYGQVSGLSCEQDPAAPVSPYGVTKLAAEQLCLVHAARADTDLEVVVLRYFTVYGPRQRRDMAISRVLRAALSRPAAGPQFQLYGDGSQRREFTYIDDVVTATIAAGVVPLPAGVVVNIGGGSTASMRDVLDLAEEITGRPVPVLSTGRRPGDVEATGADLTRARALLGYRPSVDLREGMTRHATWLAGTCETLATPGVSTRSGLVRASGSQP